MSTTVDTGGPRGRGDRPPEDESAGPAPAPLPPPTGRLGSRWKASRLGAWTAVARIVIGVLVAHFVLVLFPQSLLHSRPGTLSTGTWAGAFDRWDAAYYTTIAAHGYTAHAPDARAFFPGYPLVVRLVYEVSGGVLSLVQAACLVSSVAFVAAAYLLAGLVGRRFGNRVALVSTTLFCWCPTSVFFLAPYSEALFALEILAVAALVQRGRWWWAALISGYATATSPEAVVVTAALVVAALVAHRGVWRAVGYALVGSFGIAGFAAFLDARFGSPLAFTRVQTDFHRIVVFPFSGLVRNIAAIDQVLTAHRHDVAVLPNLSVDVLWSTIAWMWFVDDLVLVVALVALAVLVVRMVADRRGLRPAGCRVPVHWPVILAGFILISSATVIRQAGYDSTESAARLVSVAFPLYLGLALLMRRRAVPLILGVGLSVGAAVAVQVMFNLGYWVT